MCNEVTKTRAILSWPLREDKDAKRSKSMSAPALQPLMLDGMSSCSNLSGVIVGTAARATMKFAPAVPLKRVGFRSFLRDEGWFDVARACWQPLLENFAGGHGCAEQGREASSASPEIPSP